MSTNDNSGQKCHPPFVKPSTRLRQLLAQPGCLQAPGVYDGISARLAIEAGFPCMVSPASKSIIIPRSA